MKPPIVDMDGLSMTQQTPGPKWPAYGQREYHSIQIPVFHKEVPAINIVGRILAKRRVANDSLAAFLALRIVCGLPAHVKGPSKVSVSKDFSFGRRSIVTGKRTWRLSQVVYYAFPIDAGSPGALTLEWTTP